MANKNKKPSSKPKKTKGKQSKLNTEILQDYPTKKLPCSFKTQQEFLKKNKILLMEHAIDCIEYAINNKLDLIEIFEYPGTNFVILVTKEEYKENINYIYDHFIKNELYEKCTKIATLQKKLNEINVE